jgi:serine/threonine protein phosphatase PrpC
LRPASSPPPVRGHIVAYRTDIGYAHHINQDAGGAWGWIREDGLPASLIVVADGVSAGRHSEEASRRTVDIVYRRMAHLLQDAGNSLEVLLDALFDAAKEANHEVAKRPHYSLRSADATTLVAAFCVGDEGGGIWCGDSRVYYLGADGQARKLTRDHSWAEQVVLAGLLSPEEAAHDPRAHMITRWLGPPLQEDPGIETFRFELAPGDAVMCCTDGLYGYFAPPEADDEDDLARLLAGDEADLYKGVNRLVDIALERGGRDNITLAVISADAEPREPSDRPARGEGKPREEETTVHLPTPVVNASRS